MSDHFDAIVLGLGAVGSATARALAARGRRVLGIDRFAPPHAWGSSTGDTRITRQAIGEGLEYVPLALRSYELWREIEGATGEELLTVTGGLVLGAPEGGGLHGRPRFLQQTLAAAEAFGIPHQVLEGAELARRFPQFRAAAGEVAYYEPGAGFLRPERCVAAQLALARRHGAELHLDETVLEFGGDGEGVSVASAAGHYRAQWLVIAAGPWLPGLLEPDLAATFHVYRQVQYWFAAGSGVASVLPERCPFLLWGEPYWFPAVDGPDGGVKVAMGQFRRTTTPEAVDRRVSAAETGAMYREFVAERLPGLGEQCLRSRVCLYTGTPDGGFVIDRHPRLPNVLLASPCSGHGFKHSAAVGEALAELVTTGTSRIDLTPFSLARFAAAP